MLGFIAAVLGATLTMSPLGLETPPPLVVALFEITAAPGVSEAMSHKMTEELVKRFESPSPYWTFLASPLTRDVLDKSIESEARAIAIGLSRGWDVVIYGSIRFAPLSQALEDGSLPYVLDIRLVNVRRPGLSRHVGEVGSGTNLEQVLGTIAWDAVAGVKEMYQTNLKMGASSIRGFDASEEAARKVSYRFMLGTYGTYNMMGTGYTSYENGLGGGVEMHVRGYDAANRLQMVGYSLGFENVAMMVPAGTNGTSEDLMNVSAGYLFSFFHHLPVHLTAGLGAGLYVDWVRLNTPVSGPLSALSMFFGFSPRLGVEIPLGSMRAVTEFRYHLVFPPSKGSYMATHGALHIGLMVEL